MALSNSQRNELFGLCIAMFKAAPGENYLTQLVAAREAGSSLLDIATALAAKPQFQLAYPGDMTFHDLELVQGELAQHIVGNLLAIDTPMNARSWATSWVYEKLHAGVSIASVLLEAAQALMSTDNPAYASAKALMLNRIEVAAYYSVTQEQSSTDLVALRDVLAGVSPASASVAAAKAAIDANLGSKEFILTTGVDHLTGTDGDDRFIAGLNATVFTGSDELDGGAGTDTLTIYTTPTINDDFPNNATLSNIEIINIYYASPTDTVVDASKFTGASVINVIGGGRATISRSFNSLSNVADDQKVTIQGIAKVIATGYHSETADTPEVYAGTLDITISPSTEYIGDSVAYVYADTVNLTVMGGTETQGGYVYVDGDAKVAHVTLVPTIDNAGTSDITTDDVYEMPSLYLATSAVYPSYSFEALTNLTLSGNGHASISNGNQNLITIDASGLESRDIHGVAGAGLSLFSRNGQAETIKLSDGLDQLQIGNSSIARTDTIYDFVLVDDASITGKQVDLDNSDRLVLVTHESDPPSLSSGFVKAAVSAGNLDQALTILAASANDRVVFHFGGNTYVYRDLSGSVYDVTGRAPDESSFFGNDTADETDILVKLVGTLDLDLLSQIFELADSV